MGCSTLYHLAEAGVSDAILLGRNKLTSGTTWHSAAQVATGGGAGMALAHCIVHGHPPTDLHEADPKRFPSCFNSAAALAERAPEVLGKHYEITYPAHQWATSRGLRPTPLEGRWRAENAPGGTGGVLAGIGLPAATPTPISRERCSRTPIRTRTRDIWCRSSRC